MTEDKTGFSFKCQANCSHTQARAGVFATPHGVVETPKFMPVGTLANVKTLTPAHLEAAGSQMVLANTYHLHLQPGEAIVAGAGGLHKFMAWPGPMLTDSGGFQVFSLSQMRTITDDGVTFRSPRDGRMINLTPERSIEIQNQLGADVIMAFDECPPYPLHGRRWRRQQIALTAGCNAAFKLTRVRIKLCSGSCRGAFSPICDRARRTSW